MARAALTTGLKNMLSSMFTPCPVPAQAISPKALHTAKENKLRNTRVSHTRLKRTARTCT